jgi:predicted phosphoribosyltransferase
MIAKFFQDRTEAGRFLAQRLWDYENNPKVVVLALPRGGVPVGYEVAQAVKAPLDVFVLRKLGVPGYNELAMGAIATGGIRILNQSVVDYLDISDKVIDLVASREQRELERRERLYRGTRPALDVRGRTVIIVDDGMATGASMRAAVGLCVNSNRIRSLLQFLWVLERLATCSLVKSIRCVFVRSHRNHLMELGFGIEILNRRQMRTFGNCSRV